MTQPLSAIEKEELEKFKGYPSWPNSDEWLRGVMRRVAEEAIAAVIPERIENPTPNGELLNAARTEMQTRAKLFLEDTK